MDDERSTVPPTAQLSACHPECSRVERMVTAATSLMKDYFDFSQRQIKNIVNPRLRLTRCVRNVVTFVRTKTTYTRHILAAACEAAVLPAKDEKLVRKKVSFELIHRSNNLHCLVTMKKLQEIVRRADSGELDEQDVRVVCATVATRRSTRRRTGTPSAS